MTKFSLNSALLSLAEAKLKKGTRWKIDIGTSHLS